MPLQRTVLAVSVGFLLWVIPGASQAQYLYTDTNGNGVHDSGDGVNNSGPTAIAIWLNSAFNRDGSPAACADTRFGMLGVVLHASGGTISNLSYSAGSISTFLNSSSTTDAYIVSNQIYHAGGLFLLGTLTLDATPGTAIAIVTSAPLPICPLTWFGSPCAGATFDGALRLGVDWFDVDDLNSAPGLTVTGPATAPHGAPLCLNVQATDADAGDILTISYQGAPPSLSSFVHTPSVSPATAQLCGTPTCGEVGILYTVVFSVSDGINAPVTQSHALTITNAAPTVTAPATKNGPVLSIMTFSVTATDADGDPLTFTTSGSAFANGASFTDNLNGSGTFLWTPCAAGPYSATFTAHDICGATGSATTGIMISNAARYVRGKVFFDDNGNATGLCSPEGGELGLVSWTIQMRNSLNAVVSSTTTNAAGDYQCSALAPGTYTLRALPPSGTNSYWAQSCPPGAAGFQTVNLACTGLATGVNFGQNNQGTNQDLATTILLNGLPKPGYTRAYSATYVNKGNTTVGGATLKITLPVVAQPISIQSWDPRFTPAVVGSPPSVTWHLPVLLPGNSDQVYVYVKINVATPTGTKLNASSLINPTGGDSKPADNSSASSVKVVSAQDPNDKSVLPEGYVLRADTLRYHVNFQNVGTATADSVAVLDILDDDLDPESVEVLGASHNYSVEIQDHQMTWIFPAIGLADSTSDEPASHGALEYTVRPKTDAPDGAVIQNTASIYFDFNPAVLTNTVQNTIDSPPLLLPVPDRTAVEGGTTQQSLLGSDPEADPLTFALVTGPSWASVLTTGSSTGRIDLAPQSGDAGTVTITVNASDGILTDEQSFTVNVLTVTGVALSERFEAQAIRLATNQVDMCVRLAPLSGAFRAADVDRSSVVLRSSGTGSISNVQSTGFSSNAGDSLDNAQVCFSSASLRSLFADVDGSKDVSVLCEGKLRTGERFSGTLPLRISAAAGALAAAVTPNPIHQGATLRYRTHRAGRVRVLIYDVNGRVRRILLDAPSVPAGYHEVPLGGSDRSRGALTSGIYFYRVETSEGVQSGRVVVLR